MHKIQLGCLILVIKRKPGDERDGGALESNAYQGSYGVWTDVGQEIIKIAYGTTYLEEVRLKITRSVIFFIFSSTLLEKFKR